MIKGITFGAWDLMHAGHLLMLEEAKKHCDYLVVGFHIDPSQERKSKNKPIESVLERHTRIKACKFIDDCVPYETEEDVLTILNNGDFDIRFIGEDYQDKDFTGKGIVPEYYTSRKHNYSSTNLRNRIKNG